MGTDPFGAESSDMMGIVWVGDAGAGDVGFLVRETGVPLLHAPLYLHQKMIVQYNVQ